MGKKSNLGAALLGFGASFGMGLSQEWRRASKQDREAGFLNWLKGEKPKPGTVTSDAAKPIDAKASEPAPVSGEFPQDIATAYPVADPEKLTPAALPDDAAQSYAQAWATPAEEIAPTPQVAPQQEIKEEGDNYGW